MMARDKRITGAEYIQKVCAIVLYVRTLSISVFFAGTVAHNNSSLCTVV